MYRFLLLGMFLPMFSYSQDVYYISVENPPQYIGGSTAMYQFIGRNFKYPQELDAIKKNYFGAVEVKINENGGNDGVRLLNSPIDCKSCDEEALRIGRLLTDWQVGKQNGKPIKCLFIVPIMVSYEKKCIYTTEPYAVKGWRGAGKEVYHCN